MYVSRGSCSPFTDRSLQSCEYELLSLRVCVNATAAACSITTPTFTFREKATRQAERQEKAAKVQAVKAARRVRVSKAKYDEARHRYDDDKKAGRPRGVSLDRGSAGGHVGGGHVAGHVAGAAKSNDWASVDAAWVETHPRRASSEPRPSVWLQRSPPRAQQPEEGGGFGGSSSQKSALLLLQDAKGVEAKAMATANRTADRATSLIAGVANRVQRMKITIAKRSSGKKRKPNGGGTTGGGGGGWPRQGRRSGEELQFEQLETTEAPKDEFGLSYSEFMERKAEATAAGYGCIGDLLRVRRSAAEAAKRAIEEAQAATEAAAVEEERRRRRRVEELLAKAREAKRAHAVLTQQPRRYSRQSTPRRTKKNGAAVTKGSSSDSSGRIASRGSRDHLHGNTDSRPDIEHARRREVHTYWNTAVSDASGIGIGKPVINPFLSEVGLVSSAV